MSTGHEAFLSYDELNYSLLLLSIDNNDIGTITVTLEAYLVNYPGVKRSTTFTVEVTECEVLSLQGIATPNQLYKVNEAPLVFQLSEVIQVPECDAQVNYLVEVATDVTGTSFDPLPSWMTQTSPTTL